MRFVIVYFAALFAAFQSFGSPVESSVMKINIKYDESSKVVNVLIANNATNIIRISRVSAMNPGVSFVLSSSKNNAGEDLRGLTMNFRSGIGIHELLELTENNDPDSFCVIEPGKNFEVSIPLERIFRKLASDDRVKEFVSRAPSDRLHLCMSLSFTNLLQRNIGDVGTKVGLKSIDHSPLIRLDTAGLLNLVR